MNCMNLTSTLFDNIHVRGLGGKTNDFLRHDGPFNIEKSTIWTFGLTCVGSCCYVHIWSHLSTLLGGPSIGSNHFREAENLSFTIPFLFESFTRG